MFLLKFPPVEKLFSLDLYVRNVYSSRFWPYSDMEYWSALIEYEMLSTRAYNGGFSRTAKSPNICHSFKSPCSILPLFLLPRVYQFSFLLIKHASTKPTGLVRHGFFYQQPMAEISADHLVLVDFVNGYENCSHISHSLE